LTLPPVEQISNDRALCRDPAGGPAGALAHRIVDEIAGLAMHGPRRRDDRVHHRTNRAGDLLDHLARGDDGAAALVAVDHDQRRAEVLGAAFDYQVQRRPPLNDWLVAFWRSSAL
jgi:hypothetical protein